MKPMRSHDEGQVSLETLRWAGRGIGRRRADEGREGGTLSSPLHPTTASAVQSQTVVENMSSIEMWAVPSQELGR